MTRHRNPRPVWRTLTPAEKQLRLERLRRAQHQQLVRDARVLTLHEG